jgi:hypothetical protein
MFTINLPTIPLNFLSMKMFTLIAGVIASCVTQASAIASTSNTAEFTISSEVKTTFHPESMDTYLQVRDSCEWTQRHDQLQDCIVSDVGVPEGRGLVKIIRHGPFSLKGGQSHDMLIPKTVLEPGTWLKGHVIAATDAYTGGIMEYPPTHIHHAISIRAETSSDDPYHLAFSGHYPKTSADYQCSSEGGGTSCFSNLIPEGFAIKAHTTPDRYTAKVNDVRKEGAPPLLQYFEMAELYLQESDLYSGVRLKEVTSVAYGYTSVGQSASTYPVIPTVANFGVVTYQFSDTRRFIASNPHSHWREGDEMWVMRGTQDDLGIPAHQQTSVVSLSVKRNNQRFDIDDVEDKDMTEFKATLEQSMKRAQNLHSSSSSFRKPEILCKWTSVMENFSTETIRARTNKLLELYNTEVSDCVC